MQNKHRNQIKSLLSTIPNATSLWQELDFVMRTNPNQFCCYVMMCQNMVIGVASIIEEFDSAYLQSHYDLYPINFKFCKSGSQGLIENIVVSPIFEIFSSFFLRELHRQSEFDVLYYKIEPNENSGMFRERPINNLLPRFLPMMPVIPPECNVASLKAQGE